MRLVQIATRLGLRGNGWDGGRFGRQRLIDSAALTTGTASQLLVILGNSAPTPPMREAGWSSMGVGWPVHMAGMLANHIVT